VYFTDGAGNTGIPGFNESTIGGRDIDADGDGVRDVDFQNVNNNAANIDQTFISEQKLYNVMAYGEYTLEGEANITPFFEANYSRAEIQSDNTGTPQIFPYVSATNQFNPCFRGTGVDCRATENATFGTGLGGGFDLPVIPIVTVQGDRNNVDVEQEQLRFVGGVKGDLPFLSAGPLNNWTFEASGSYSKSKGKSFRQGIREDKLAFALGVDPTADFDADGITDNNGDGIADDYDQNVRIGGIFGGPEIAACDASALANPGQALADLTDGCVPVNLFAPSLLGQTIGDFATAAERNYVFGTRNFDTTYEQTLFSAFATGNVFEMPAGQVAMVVGAEWREDKIDSTPSVEASNGLLFGFASDRGAVGSKWIREAFAEIDIPLLADKPLFRELGVNFSGRVTDEEFYGTAGTYSIKGGWRPVDSLLLKASFGTSFRAPNLRENFLAGQSGFPTVLDRCAVPDVAFVDITPNDGVVTREYVAALDTREPETLANCLREGRDPTTTGIDANGLNTFTSPSVENTTGGTLDLEAETSESFTAGFAFEQPFSDDFDFNIGVNYYQIDIKGAVTQPSAQFIVDDCYTRQDGSRSPFCDRITVGANDDRRLISDISSGFINLNKEEVSGVDVNATFEKELVAFGENVDFSVNLRANKLLERNNLFVGTNGEESLTELAGEFGFPEWTGRTTFTADVDKFRLTWQTRYIGKVEQDPEGIDEFDDATGTQGTGFFGETCLGAAAGDFFCRDVGFAKEYFTHAASIRYRDDSLTLRVGVSNVFDRNPPLVDSGEVFAISNTPIGNGYDLDGRQFFVSATKQF
jgi:iron complex outermembrane receptor protein